MSFLYIDWNFNPIIVNIFDSFHITYYGILFVSGIYLGYFFVKKTYRIDNFVQDSADKLLIYVTLGIIIGARLGHCIFYDFNYYIHNIWEMILPFKFENKKFIMTGYSGLASHGGAIGLLLAVIIYSKKNKENFWVIIDKIAIVTPLAGTFIRLGNLCNSEIIGKPTTFLFAFIFHRVDSIPRHPTQLYEAICYFSIFIVLWFIFLKFRKAVKPGFFFGLSIFLIFIIRFLIEFFKENQSSFENQMTINMGQLLSIPFIICGGAIIFYNLFCRKKTCAN